MQWLYLLLFFGALVVAFKTAGALMGLALLAALGFLLAFILKLAAARVGSRSRDEHLMLDPEELRRFREQAEARKLAASSQSEPPQ